MTRPDDPFIHPDSEPAADDGPPAGPFYWAAWAAHLSVVACLLQVPWLCGGLDAAAFGALARQRLDDRPARVRRRPTG